MARVAALTGASGFVGRHLVDALLDRGWHLRLLVRDRQRLTGDLLASPFITPVIGSLEDTAALRDLVAGSEVVLHLAGLIKARRATDFEAVNGAGTARLLEAVAGRIAPPRFVLLSSLAAREAGISSYAGSKRHAEQLVEEAGTSLHWHVLRAPAVYGQGDRATLPLFQQMRRGFLIAPAGGGHRFSLIHVQDLAQGLALLAEGGLVSGLRSSIHDGEAAGYSWGEMASRAATVLDRPIKVVALPQEILSLFAALSYTVTGLVGRESVLSPEKVREIFVDDWVCESPFLQELTAWRPQVTLEEGFARTIDWYRAWNLLK